MSNRTKLIILVLVIASVTTAAWTLPIGDWLAEPAAVGTPAPAARALTAEETAYYRYVSPRLRALQGETSKLLELGRARSRNLIELQERQDRVDDVSGQIDEFLREAGTPARFAPAMDEYAAGITAARSAIWETRAGISRLDWDRVGKAVDIFGIAVERLGAAMRRLEDAGGSPATPMG